MSPGIQREILRLTETRIPFALCTVVEVKGSVPGKLGAQMIVRADGSQMGTVGGAGLEEKVKAAAREAMKTRKGGTQAYDLMRRKPGGLDSVCGGTVSVFVEPILPKPHALLCGGGHFAYHSPQEFGQLRGLFFRLGYPPAVRRAELTSAA